MIFPGIKEKYKWPNVNKDILAIKGDIEDDKAKALLAQFLIWNPGFSWHLMSGMELEPMQDFILRNWITKNYSMNIWSRGGSKTELAAVFCGLYSVIEPMTKIVIAAPGFRKSREVLERLDNFINGPKAGLLRQCVNMPLKRKNDLYEMKIGQATLNAIPLNPLVRGFRSTCLIVDEMLLVGEELFTSVLFPFLSANTGIQEALKIKNMEDLLIRQGLITEEQRTLQKSIKKIILLSSASYEFAYMFELYNHWISQVIDAKKQDDKLKGTFFISQFSFEAIPKTIMDLNIVKQAQESMSEAMFAREYGGQFSKDSGAFFSAAKMEKQTIKEGEFPCAEMKGEPGAQYIVTIDTNQSESESSDNFAMSVLKLIPETRSLVLVHAYAKPQYDFKKYSKYFLYLLEAFNPILIWIDESGGGFTFINGCKESQLFKDYKIKLDKLDVDFDKEDFVTTIKEAKVKYNKEAGRIVYGQTFQTTSIGTMNDWLQIILDKGRIYFASPLSAQEKIFERAEKEIPAYLIEDFKDRVRDIQDFIDDIDDMIQQTKSETSLIEISISPLGARTFSLPQNIKRSTSPNRPRKDSYTALLMGCYAAKIWYEMMDVKEELQTFTPQFI